jgi:hypothetical protein
MPGDRASIQDLFLDVQATPTDAAIVGFDPCADAVSVDLLAAILDAVVFAIMGLLGALWIVRHSQFLSNGVYPASDFRLLLVFALIEADDFGAEVFGGADEFVGLIVAAVEEDAAHVA